MCEVVVGIDFGSSGTGYAYSFNNHKNIEPGKFPSQNVEVKVPTQIILDSTLKTVKAFGNQCDISLLGEDDLYFKKIKMHIYHNESYIKPENNSKEFPLIDIISKIFEYISEEALAQLNQRKAGITKDQIKWIVTVPSIWNLEQKTTMIKASENAGLFNKNTDRSNFLANEAEAASLYCSFDDSIDKNYLNPGKTYIVCDLGGGTGDIVIHYKTEADSIKEIYRPIGGPYGSEEINKEFFYKIFFKLFGYSDYLSLLDKCNYLRKNNNQKVSSWKDKDLYNEWKDLQKKISSYKKITNNQRNQNFTLNCQIFEDFTDNSLQVLVDKYNESCPEGWKIGISNEKKWILSFPYKIFFDLIENQASKISDQISEVYKNSDSIESIFYVGGYSSNEVLISYIKNKFPKLSHLKPSYPQKAVLNGAVLFGLYPEIIKIRKAPYSIGFNCDDLWDENIHGGIGQKYHDPKSNTDKCRNSFHSFIKKGQDISKDYIVEQGFITMNSRIIMLKFFKSEKENPVLWTENGVELMGDVKLDLGQDYPEEERDFIIKLKFGGTFVDATCYHLKSGRELSFPLYFNK